MGCLTGIFLLFLILIGYGHSQCEVLGTERNDATDIHHCHQMYRIFEEALLSNKDNLYTLQEVFFSSEHQSPSMLTVNYHLKTPDMEISNISAPIIWSSSNLFVYVHPVLFTVCEPALAVLFFQLINAQVLPIDIDLSLSLNLSSIPRNVTAEQSVHTLFMMTARVSYRFKV